MVGQAAPQADLRALFRRFRVEHDRANGLLPGDRQVATDVVHQQQRQHDAQRHDRGTERAVRCHQRQSGHHAQRARQHRDRSTGGDGGAPLSVFNLAADQTSPRSLAVGPTYLFWLDARMNGLP